MNYRGVFLAFSASFRNGNGPHDCDFLNRTMAPLGFSPGENIEMFARIAEFEKHHSVLLVAPIRMRFLDSLKK